MIKWSIVRWMRRRRGFGGKERKPGGLQVDCGSFLFFSTLDLAILSRQMPTSPCPPIQRSHSFLEGNFPQYHSFGGNHPCKAGKRRFLIGPARMLVGKRKAEASVFLTGA